MHQAFLGTIATLLERGHTLPEILAALQARGLRVERPHLGARLTVYAQVSAMGYEARIPIVHPQQAPCTAAARRASMPRPCSESAP